MKCKTSRSAKAVAVLSIVAITTGACAQQSKSASAGAKEKDQKSYSLGYQFGRNIKEQPVQLDLEAIVTGLRDAFAGKTPSLSAQEMEAAVEALKKEVQAAQQAKHSEQSAKSLKDGNAYLAQNAKKEGVKTLPSGLQYKVLREGSGPSPKPTDQVEVNYRGTFVNGTEFDSSFARKQPAKLRLGEVIQGWQEALKLMKTGARWQIVLPPGLAYGDRPVGPIPPNSTLVFEIELLSIVEGAKPQAK